MAKVPRPPRPKLPKPKISLGQQVKQETKRAAAKSLEKNFGVLGTAIAKRIFPPSKSTKPVKEEKAIEKRIAKDKIKNDASPPDAITDTAKNISKAMDTFSSNASRSFAAVSKQATVMGDDITASLNDLNSLLDKLLFQRNSSFPVPVDTGKTSTKKTNNDDDETSGPSPRWFRRTPRKPRSLRRRWRATNRLNRMKGFRAGKNPFGRMRFRPRIGILAPLMEGINSYQEMQEGQSIGRTITGFVGGVGGGFLGGTGGATIGSAVGPLGTFAGGIAGASIGASVGHDASQALYDKIFGAKRTQDGKVKIGDDGRVIQKMTYHADKIIFKARDFIEFKSLQGQSSDGASAPVGALNGAVDSIRGGAGGAGFFNTLADKLFGTGGGNGRGGDSSPTGSRPASSNNGSTEQTVKPNSGTTSSSTSSNKTIPDIDYSGPSKDEYNSKTAKANFMQPNEFGAPGSNITGVKTQGGHNFQINSNSSEAFKRTIEDLESAGAPLGSIGGYNPRPGGIAGTGRLSQHAMGNAMDIGSQSARDVVSPQFRQWIQANPNKWRAILDRNGMISGGDWKNPDLGHIEWSGRKPWIEKPENAAQSQPISPKSNTPEITQISPNTEQPSMVPPTPTVPAPSPKQENTKDQLSDDNIKKNNDIWWGRKNSQSSQQDMDSGDMDHRSKMVPAKQQSYSEYMSTTNGMEDLP